MKALKIAALHFDDSEKKELKRKLAGSKKELNNTKAFHRLDMEDINHECIHIDNKLISMHDKLVDGFSSSNGISLSQAEVWEMMSLISVASDHIQAIQATAVKKMRRKW